MNSKVTKIALIGKVDNEKSLVANILQEKKFLLNLILKK